jgi:hypothetical protein
MALKSIDCREHGGRFTIEARRGRPPVRCSPDNQCDVVINETRPRKGKQATPAEVKAAADRAMNQPRAAQTASRIKNRRAAERLQEAREEIATVMATPPPESAVQPRSLAKGVLAKARAAKSHLEALGWKVVGQGSADQISVTGSRGEETISIIWHANGTVSQNYSLWDMDQPRANEKPASKLGFDPDELPDRELVERISGMKVTWWNRLASGEESAVIPDKVIIEHCYNGIGNETPGDRIVKFVDVMGGGFRAFRVGALMKIG